MEKRVYILVAIIIGASAALIYTFAEIVSSIHFGR